MVLGRINKLETFGSVDGPGVRFVVFTQGCPMRCLFCHNPETWDFKGENEGAFDISPEDLLKRALRYQSYWGRDGGITVSGGEPLMQMDFLIEFFELAKAAGVNTCIDTSGVNFVRSEPYFGKFKRLMASTDLLLVDLKIIDPAEHKKLTGHGIEHNLDMFRYLDEIQKPIWIRHVLVPGISDNDEYLHRAREFIDTLHNVQKVEVLPYHSLATAKYKQMGIDYALKEVKSPEPERVANARKILGAL